MLSGFLKMIAVANHSNFLPYSVIKQIIVEQLLKMKETFNDLSTLETAEVTASDRLHVVRLSMRARVSVVLTGAH